jgi:hypothetical protein
MIRKYVQPCLALVATLLASSNGLANNITITCPTKESWLGGDTPLPTVQTLTFDFDNNTLVDGDGPNGLYPNALPTPIHVTDNWITWHGKGPRQVAINRTTGVLWWTDIVDPKNWEEVGTTEPCSVVSKRIP